MNVLVRCVLLTAVWLVLWGDLTWANVISGALVSGAVLAWFPLDRPARPRTFRPLALVRFVLTAGWSVARANLVVAWEVVTPSNRINEAVVAVPVHTDAPAVIALVSHAITLAPGTIVIDITGDEDPDRPTMLHIHALHFRSIDDCEHEVRQLERLAAAAFPARAPSPGAAS